MLSQIKPDTTAQRYNPSTAAEAVTTERLIDAKSLRIVRTKCTRHTDSASSSVRHPTAASF